MKLVKIRDENLTENYIELYYNKMDDETEHIIYIMNQSLDYLDGMVNGQKVSIRIEDILFAGIYTAIGGFCFGSIYLLTNRNVKLSYILLCIMFIL